MQGESPYCVFSFGGVCKFDNDGFGNDCQGMCGV